MRRFQFPLDRVLRIRRLEMEQVESHLSELAFRARSQRQTADERRDQAYESGKRLLAQPELKGADFQIARHWLARLESERGKAMQTSEKLDQQHRQALGGLIEARRKVKLLETLRKRKHDAHQRETAKQLEAQASEFYLAKRIRDKR